MFRENNTFLFFAKCNLLQILSREDILNTIFGIYNLVAQLSKQMPHYFVLETKIAQDLGSRTHIILNAVQHESFDQTQREPFKNYLWICFHKGGVEYPKNPPYVSRGQS